MKLDEMRTADGRSLHKALEAVLMEVEGDPGAVDELYASLWDIHDASMRVVRTIEELAVQDPTNQLDVIGGLLFKIQAELYGHISKHLETLQPVLEETATSIADRL